MNIAFVVDSRLPAELYGGTERVVWGLMATLHSWGHRLWLVAQAGTTCPFAEVIVPQTNLPLEEQLPSEIDIVHFHTSVPEGFSLPHLITVHGNSLPQGSGLNSVFVSQNHAQRFGVDSYVHNGLLWEDYPTPQLQEKRKHYHFLGKAAWRVKNLNGAIDLIKSLPKVELDVLGGHRLNFKMGFRFTLSPRIHFYGMVNDQTKANRLERSQGLIFPVRWHEPFGLAVIESLYYGAPVFATPYGSLPELISNEQLGYLSSHKAELAQAMQELSFSPIICHDYARTQFSAERMSKEYLTKYEAILSGTTLCKQLPQAIDISRELPWA